MNLIYTVIGIDGFIRRSFHIVPIGGSFDSVLKETRYDFQKVLSEEISTITIVGNPVNRSILANRFLFRVTIPYSSNTVFEKPFNSKTEGLKHNCVQLYY